MQRPVCILALLWAVASASEVTPVQKVVAMMEKMVAKGQSEKDAEEAQFTAYVKFCENTTVEKGRRINEGEESIEHLTAEIEKAAAETDELQQEIAELQSLIDSTTAELENATAVRKEEHEDYTKALKDYDDTLAAMAKALTLVTSSSTDRAQVALLQLSEAVNKSKAKITPSEASQYLDNFLRGVDVPAESKPSASLLSEPVVVSEPEALGYEHHSGGIIGLLNELTTQFKKERNTLKMEELKKKNTFLTLAAGLKQDIDDASDDKSRKESRRGVLLEEKATNEGDLEETKTVLAADTKYKKDLEMDWKKQAADFAARQKLRAEELVAVKKAIELISGESVAGSAEKHLPKLLQVDTALALLTAKQLRASPVQKLAQFLQQEAQRLESKQLAALAMKVTANPIDKVKTMMQDMIANIQKKLDEEGTQKAWCDEELSKNKATRSDLSDEAEGLEGKVDKLEASIQALKADLSALSDSLTETKQAMANATELRTQEKEENTATIADAKAAQGAVEQALKVLQDFYEKAGKATALAQVGSAQPIPEALEAGPYKGMGAESGGVIGLVEVIQSDFARLEAETTSAENTAASEYESFMEDSKLDVTSKEKDVEYKTVHKESAERKLSSKEQELASVEKELAAATTTYETLKPQCADAHPTFEERKAERDAEIKSLEAALEGLRSAR
eukprot:CAMPEP_0197655894 /NCGR_PEP_ID=MMETSP1338-20131121/39731_1 /TAXON_ID=43686 ORGANISM="Pelagodinium beii, Strain RCC1491" /NCGR_SAMPLE_ID=MMETSP1338 /ASSEMBLY_ACC=CAM_ASM_000754 /LENGTH=681 /DNA_ID=CAMNT_0043231635 /DNA_START=80 /DNA_END=2125 /DNA_ORIENTATION=-